MKRGKALVLGLAALCGLALAITLASRRPAGAPRLTVRIVVDQLRIRRAPPQLLLAETLGDRLKRRHPGSRVVALSTKDRRAILMAGRKGDAACWYSDPHGCFITSSYYMKEAPGWAGTISLPGRKMWRPRSPPSWG